MKDKKVYSISICLATYNGERYVKQQIDSIICQLDQGDELIVSDDGSSDSTVEILESYGPLLKVVGTSRLGNITQNFQRALLHAKNDIVVFCDQDDVWLERRISTIKENFEPDSLLMLNGYWVDKNLVKSGFEVFDKVNPSKSFIRNLIKNSFIGCCMAFDRELIVKFTPFPNNLIWHDWFIGLVFSISGKIIFIHEPSMYFRRHDNNASSTGMKSKNSIFRMFNMRINMFKAILFSYFKKYWI